MKYSFNTWAYSHFRAGFRLSAGRGDPAFGKIGYDGLELDARSHRHGRILQVQSRERNKQPAETE